MPLELCPGCGADLGPRRRCLTFDIELVDEQARVRGSLARAGERELEIARRSGKILKAYLSPGARRLGVEDLREGVELEALGAPPPPSGAAASLARVSGAPASTPSSPDLDRERGEGSVPDSAYSGRSSRARPPKIRAKKAWTAWKPVGLEFRMAQLL